MNTLYPCPDKRHAATITWQARLTATVTITYTIIGGRWHWRRSEPNARNSIGYSSYTAATAAAKLAHGIPPIGQSGQHITSVEEAIA